MVAVFGLYNFVHNNTEIFELFAVLFKIPLLVIKYFFFTALFYSFEQIKINVSISKIFFILIAYTSFSNINYFACTYAKLNIFSATFNKFIFTFKQKEVEDTTLQIVPLTKYFHASVVCEKWFCAERILSLKAYFSIVTRHRF